MLESKHITGIILAGGKSSRMGTDKGFLDFNGKPFIQHSIDAMKSLVDDILIVSDNPGYDIFNQRRITDLIKDSGPLAGLYSGLNASKTMYNLVLSCDIPLINKSVLTHLLNNINEDIEVTQLKSREHNNPLIAIYKTTCKKTCLELLNQGEKRLGVAIQHLNSKTITLGEDLEGYTANINTPNELKNIKDAINH